MKVLVTGGAGYVGSHCVKRLCEANCQVTVFDNLVDGGHRDAVDARAKLVVGDLADRKLLNETVASGGFTGVMHFAGYLNVAESVAKPLEYYRNNFVNTQNLLEAMQQNDIDNIVFSSTCATYGIPEKLPITEDAPQAPITPYGRSKLAVEWALRDCASAWNLAATALRYFNASGAAADQSIGEDRTPEYHLVPLVLQVALGQRDHIKIFGTDYPTSDGTCVRDYIHVDDLADAHLRALRSPKPASFRAYNVGTGTGVTVREVIEAARKVTGHPIPAVESPRRPGDPPQLYADSAAIRKQLDWQPRHVDISSVVESAWHWHRTHPEGFATS